MYFDFEDNHPDISPIERAISWREGLLLSFVIHLLVTVAVLSMPAFPGADDAARRLEQQILLEKQREREAPRFVFVQPRLDMPATRPPTPRAEASDKDRNAQAPARSKNPTNDLPFSRGNTPERVEALATAPPQPVPARPPSPASSQQQAAQPGQGGQPGQNGSDAKAPGPNAVLMPGTPQLAMRGQGGTGGRTPGLAGSIGDALRNLQRYVQADSFDNQGGGGGAFGPSIQFDTKGVEFGPWIRRFIAQIKRNWNIPYAAMAMKGHVVVTFYVHKDGSITELSVPGPCDVDGFNNAAYGALAASNPTYPLPPEYPTERAFFTVTFYYNETPPGGYQ